MNFPLTDLSHEEFHATLKSADGFYNTDLAAGIAAIEALQTSRHFYPWGALACAKFYHRAQRRLDALELNKEILRRNPNFLPALSQ